MSRMVSEHCKISVAMALKVCFCTCPVTGNRSCRSIILGSLIVEMGPYTAPVSLWRWGLKLRSKRELNPERD